MELKVGEVIKKLRKERNLTQERLAEYFGVSFQTISKWEKGTSYPDITILPTIASFFNVSIDRLFCQHLTNDTDYIDKIYKDYCWSDDEKAESILRETLQKYPGNFKLMQALISVLRRKDFKKYSEEILNLGCKILDDCTEDKIRWFAMQDIVFLYNQTGHKDKAVELINQFPPSMCGDDLLMHVYTGEEKAQHCSVIKERSALRLWSVYHFLSKQNIQKKNYNHAIELIDTHSNILQLMYKNEELVFVDLLVINITRKAQIYIEIGDSVNAMKSLIEAYNSIEKYNNKKYTVIYLCKLLLDKIQGYKFESLSDTDDFIILKNKLENHLSNVI